MIKIYFYCCVICLKFSGRSIVHWHLPRSIPQHRSATVRKVRLNRMLGRRYKAEESTANAVVRRKMHADIRNDFGQARTHDRRKTDVWKNKCLPGYLNYYKI